MPKLSIEQQAQRRANILNAAEQCFAAHGFHRTTMQDICKAAKVSAGAVYVYFDSKEALIEGIAERDRAEILMHLDSLSDAGDFLGGLREVLNRCVIDQPPHKSVLFMEIAQESTRNPRIADVFSKCDGMLRARLGEQVAQAKTAGKIVTDFAAADICHALMLIGDGMLLRRAVDPGFDAGHVASVFMDMMGKLLGTVASGAAETPPIVAQSFPLSALSAQVRPLILSIEQLDISGQ